MHFALYSTRGVVVCYEGFNDVRYTTMLSGIGVKTLRCSYDELYETLDDDLSGNDALVQKVVVFQVEEN